MKPLLTLLIILTTQEVVSSQIKPSRDWGAFFQKGLSTDQKIRDEARDYGIEHLIPEVCQEETAAARVDANVIKEFLFAPDHETKQNASAVLTMMTLTRADSSAVFESVIPALSKVTKEFPVKDRVRDNAITMLSSFLPILPDAAFMALLDLANKPGETQINAGQIAIGIVRRPERPECDQTLTKMLQTNSLPIWKIAGLQVFSKVQKPSPELVRTLGPLLFDQTREVKSSALSILQRSPKDQVTANQKWLIRLAETGDGEAAQNPGNFWTR